MAYTKAYISRLILILGLMGGAYLGLSALDGEPVAKFLVVLSAVMAVFGALRVYFEEKV